MVADIRDLTLCETACVSDELCRLLKEEEEIVSVGDSRIKDKIAFF